jgi:hypothetical protein
MKELSLVDKDIVLKKQDELGNLDLEMLEGI